MGRGRQKAKHTKVARELKYFSPDTNYDALERNSRMLCPAPGAQRAPRRRPREVAGVRRRRPDDSTRREDELDVGRARTSAMRHRLMPVGIARLARYRHRSARVAADQSHGSAVDALGALLEAVEVARAAVDDRAERQAGMPSVPRRSMTAAAASAATTAIMPMPRFQVPSASSSVMPPMLGEHAEHRLRRPGGAVELDPRADAAARGRGWRRCRRR